MLRSLFSFNGVLNRADFAVKSVILTAMTLGLALVLAAAAYAVMPALGWTTRLHSLLFAGVAFVIIVIPSLWASLALQARRLRHMGLPAIPATAGMFLILLAAGRLSPVLGQGIALAFLLVLLFWPGRAEAPSQAAVA